MTDAKLDTLQILLIIIIPSIIAALPSIVSSIAAWKDKRKKVAESLNEESTAAEKVSSAWEKLAEDLQARIDKMEARQIASDERMEERQAKSDEKIKKMGLKLDRQGKRIRYLEQGVQILIDQVTSMGATPNFILEEEKGEE
jgi:hypothetical protein